jgi:integrase
MMGHSSIQTTTIYAQASTDAKKKIAAAVMR